MHSTGLVGLFLGFLVVVFSWIIWPDSTSVNGMFILGVIVAAIGGVLMLASYTA